MYDNLKKIGIIFIGVLVVSLSISIFTCSNSGKYASVNKARADEYERQNNALRKELSGVNTILQSIRGELQEARNNNSRIQESLRGAIEENKRITGLLDSFGKEYAISNETLQRLRGKIQESLGIIRELRKGSKETNN
jgi:septal ring factor EnvC (AmiA/AmiB activator)